MKFVAEELLVSVIIKQYNDEGELIGKQVTTPVEVYRGRDKNVWLIADMAIDQLSERQEESNDQRRTEE